MGLKPKPVKMNVILTDPISDLLTRIMNAIGRHQYEVSMPTSKMKEQIARILHAEGYIESYEVQGEAPSRALKIKIKYKGKRGREHVIHGLQRVSKPSRRIYAGADEIPYIMGGLGITILSTPQGVMTGQQARKMRIGGEVICNVW